MIFIDINKYLAKRGQKVYSDSYLKSFTKEQLIDEIRCLEHNYANEVWGSELLTQRLKNVCEYLKQQGYQLVQINQIISVEGENR